MSTRSYIAFEDVDGTVKGVFCHWDGYLEHNGKILFEHYNSLGRAKKLVNLGSLDFIGANIEPSEYIKLFGYDETKNPDGFKKMPYKLQSAFRRENNNHVTAYYRDCAQYLTPKEQKNFLGEYMPKPQIDSFKNMDEFMHTPSEDIAVSEYLYIYSNNSWKVNFFNGETGKEYKGSLKYALNHYTKKEN